jgi:Flp pilus assembly protein TadG
MSGPALPRLQRFARDEGGTLLAEMVLVLPLFLWGYLALYVYWDSYRAINTVQKASYTVADYISRERSTLTQAEINGMDSMMEFMLDEDQDVKMRLTSIYWDPVDTRYEVQWSRSPGNAVTLLTTESLQVLAPRIPMMSDGDSAVIVETEVNYMPAFDVGLPDDTIDNFIVTRPRFLTRVCLDGETC